MLEREGEQREEEQKAKDLERERHRQELIDEMRQQQLAQLAEIKKEVRFARRPLPQPTLAFLARACLTQSSYHRECPIVAAGA